MADERDEKWFAKMSEINYQDTNQDAYNGSKVGAYMYNEMGPISPISERIAYTPVKYKCWNPKCDNGLVPHTRYADLESECPTCFGKCYVELTRID